MTAASKERKKINTKSFTRVLYLLLVLLPHAQGEHGMEVGTGEGQEGSVSGDPLLVSHQHHIAEVAVLPLFIKTMQDLRSLAH